MARKKGFGFITPDDGSADVFVNFRAISGSGYRNLEQKQRSRVRRHAGPVGPAGGECSTVSGTETRFAAPTSVLVTSPAMLYALLYAIIRRVLRLGWSSSDAEAEVLVLRHELTVLAGRSSAASCIAGTSCSSRR
jgi:CspA family cold shock protein